MIRKFVISVDKRFKVVVVADCCYSSSLLEGGLNLKVQIGDNEWLVPSNQKEKNRELAEKRSRFDHILQLASCRSTEVSYSSSDISAFTYHWTRTVRRANGNITHKNIILKANKMLALNFLDGKLGSEQHACLHSHDNQVDKLFLGGTLHNHHH